MDGFRALAIFVINLLCVIYCVRAYDPATCIRCRKSHVCVPPECFCCRDTMPLQTENVPQMVFFTFDDAVNPTVAKHYKDLFDSSRLNPNGCPIHMTLFISHRNTLYSYVREFYEQGMEIASHSVTHSHPNSQTFLREAKKQKENLARKANIPESEIVGWRSPFLEPLGDTQPTVLKELGYKYDATLTITKKGSNDKAITPFTLDHGWPYDCKIKPCPVKPHNGFWEVPVVSVKDYKNRYNCVYIDACHSPPPSENAAYKFLWDNFQRYYSTNRAPMGINMHASWFYYPDRKAAMDKFIKQLVNMDDVYILTVKQVIDWLKDPTPLNQIKTFKPWLCNGGGNETIGVKETKQTPTSKPHQMNQNQRQFSPQPKQTNAPIQSNNNAQMQSNNNAPIQSNNNAQMQSNNNAQMQTNKNAQMQTNNNAQMQTNNNAKMHSNRNAQMQTKNVQMQTNSAQMQSNNWQMQRQNQMQNNAFNRQAIGPTAVPFQTSPGLQTPRWPQATMNGLPPIPIPPMSPNFRPIRFWWRPPAMMNPQLQIEMHRREAIQRQRRMQEQQQQAQFQREQRQGIIRQEMVVKQRQQMLLQQKAEEERMRKEQLEKQRQHELKRQHLLKQQRLEKKMLEEKKRQERLRQEQLEKQKQEELKRQDLIKQQQLEKQRIQEQLRQERIKQEQLEKQKQEKLRQKKLQQQLEQQKLEEKLLQDRLQQEELRRQVQQKQQLAKQRLGQNQRQATSEKQKLEELKRQEHLQQQKLAEQNSAKSVYDQTDISRRAIQGVIGKQNTQTVRDHAFSKKLDEILTHSKKDRISMLQQLSLYELQLLQYEVNRRMAKIPTAAGSNSPLLALKKRVNQDVNGVVRQKSLQQTVGQDMLQENAMLSTNDRQGGNTLPPEPTQDIHSVTHLKRETTPQTKTFLTVGMEFTTTPPSQENTNINIKQAPLQETIPMAYTDPDVNQQIVTEKPRPIIPQETIPIQYKTTTTSAPVDNFKKGTIDKVQDIPFFNFIPPKASSFEHQTIVNSPKTKPEKKAKTPMWRMDAFDINSLSGPWKREPVPPSPKPEATTKTPMRKTSLKLLPVAISLFNTNDVRQPKPFLSYRAFVRPNLFSAEKGINTNLFSDGAVPVSAKLPQPAQNSERKNAFKFPEPVNILPAGLKTANPVQRTFVKATTTTSRSTATTTTTTTTTTVPTTTTTSATTTTATPTTTAAPTTTTTAIPTTTTTAIPTSTMVSSTTTKQAPMAFVKQASSQQISTAQQKTFQTLIPIPTHWRFNEPVVIPPYMSSMRTREPTANKQPVGCQQGDNCVLPNCFCKTESVPLGMNLQDVPQIVYITIDGSLNFHSLAKIRKLFTGRTNPNGCRVKGTMFITDAGSSYRISNLLLRDGIELAMMGMNSRPYTNKEELKSDILLQRQRIAESSNITKERIQGWRSPGFKTLGDDQLTYLNNESLYDSSLVLDRGPGDKQKLWPFTLDFGLKEDCEIAHCPNKRHPGLWEIPVIPFLGLDNSSACEYIDGCTRQPKTADDTYNYLMNNFNLYYKTNRAPFAIRLKQIWFHWYYRENLNGLFRFLDTVLGYGDVYISSISDMLDWIKKPIKLQNIDTFKPWKC